MFGGVIATQIRGLLGQLDSPLILELGAGTGRLAKSVLDAIAADGNALPDYWILEVSADLKARQRTCLADYVGCVRWLDALPDSLSYLRERGG